MCAGTKTRKGMHSNAPRASAGDAEHILPHRVLDACVRAGEQVCITYPKERCDERRPEADEEEEKERISAWSGVVGLAQW